MNCKLLADLCPCFRRLPAKLCQYLVSLACWIVPEFWSSMRESVSDSIVRALNCARFFVVCELNCARISVIRALDCARFLSHPALFPDPAGTPYHVWSSIRTRICSGMMVFLRTALTRSLKGAYSTTISRRSASLRMCQFT